MLPLEIQLFVSAVMVLTGVAAALVYDIYRSARRAFRWRGLAGEVADLAFWLICAAVLVAGLVSAHWGVVRLHTFVALGVGLLIYFGLAAPLLTPLWRACFTTLQRGGSRVLACLGSLPKPRLRLPRPRLGLPRPRLPSLRLRWPFRKT